MSAAVNLRSHFRKSSDLGFVDSDIVADQKTAADRGIATALDSDTAAAADLDTGTAFDSDIAAGQELVSGTGSVGTASPVHCTARELVRCS